MTEKVKPMEGLADWLGVMACNIGYSASRRAMLGRWANEVEAASRASDARAGVPEGYVLVPLRMNRAMREIVDSEGWDWPDLLAAAESVTEEQYDEICEPKAAPQAGQGQAVAWPKGAAFTDDEGGFYDEQARPLAAPSAQPSATVAEQGCGCRWQGEVYAHRCPLHDAWHTAIHEWAERAKTAEKKLATPTGAAAGAAVPSGEHAQRDADGIKNLRDHMACLVAIWDDRQRPKGERHYQDGAMDLQVGHARTWLKSIEGEWVNQRIAALAAAPQAGAAQRAAPVTGEGA